MGWDDQKTKYNAHNAKPFVGYVSSGNTIEMVSQSGNLICRQTASSAVLLGFIVFMIAVGVVAGSQSHEIKRLRHFLDFPLSEQIGHVAIGLLILLLVGAALVFAIEKLLFFGTLIVEPSGALRFCRGLNQQEARVVRPGEIQGMRLSKVTFRGKRTTHTNHILILQLRNAEEIVLCASPEQELVLKVRDEISRRAGIRLETESVD